LAEVYKAAGRAHIVGITGVPGSGKSTLVSKLVQQVRRDNRRVAVIAIDPSSPFSGGAILGDRIRMSELVLDPGVFIRSMATRGSTGGLARAALAAADILDVSGFDMIMIETVGVGQDEVEIARASHTTVVVSAPGLGDDVQALKAGILEIADVHVVNKADREGADRTQSDLRAMLGLLPHAEEAWLPPILPTVAAREEGIDALVDALEAHRAALAASGEGEARRRRSSRTRVLQIAQDLLADAMSARDAGEAAALVEDVARRALAPHAAARMLLDEVRGHGPGEERA